MTAEAGETQEVRAGTPGLPKPTRVSAGRSPKDKISRDIGLGLPLPSKSCDDPNCPYHGRLSVRGQIIEGVVVSDKMKRSVVVRRDYKRFVPKYERYEKRSGRYLAHNPPCIGARVGQAATIMECRPLSKAKSFVVVAVRGEAK